MKPETITLTELAERLGCHRSTVSRRAAALNLGTPVGRNVIVLTPAEVRKLEKLIRPRTRKRKRKR